MNNTTFKTASAFIALVLMYFLFCAPQTDAQQSLASDPSPKLQERFPRYRLRSGDVLELNFTFTPEFNQSVTIQPDGYVNLRGLADVRI